MSGNGQNHQLPDGLEPADDVEEEDEDDFGEFEGFEGGVERLQAQPAPSPWATFPDLLPVQSSPATPAEDGQGTSARGGGSIAPLRDVLPPPCSPGWPGGGGHEEPRAAAQQMRLSNPPDVSLGTSQAVGGRVTPDNVHDASVAVIMDHRDSGMAQVDRLSQQLENAELARARMEEQIEQLRQRNVELEQSVASQQAQIQDLQSRLQHSQESANNRLSEGNHLFAADMRQLQQEVRAVKESQAAGRREAEASGRQVGEMRTELCNRLQALESGLAGEVEVRLGRRLEEQGGAAVREAAECAAQRAALAVSGELSRLLGETARTSPLGDAESNNALLQSIREEMEKLREQQRIALEQERRRQLSALSSALRSALRHLGDTTHDADDPSSTS